LPKPYRRIVGFPPNVDSFPWSIHCDDFGLCVDWFAIDSQDGRLFGFGLPFGIEGLFVVRRRKIEFDVYNLFDDFQIFGIDVVLNLDGGNIVGNFEFTVGNQYPFAIGYLEFDFHDFDFLKSPQACQFARQSVAGPPDCDAFSHLKYLPEYLTT